MNKSLLDALKKAIDASDLGALNTIIEYQMESCNNTSLLSLYLHSAQLIESDPLIKKKLVVLLALSLHKECVKIILRDESLLNKLKDLEVDLEDTKVSFFTVIVDKVKEKKLLDKILTQQNIEQIYIKCLQGSCSHQIFGLLETAAMYNNIEFIDIFLRRAEQDVLDISEREKSIKELTKSQESLGPFGSNELSDSTLGSSSSDESDIDIDELCKRENGSKFSALNSNEVGIEPAKLSNVFVKQGELRGLVANLVNIMSTAISVEAYETISYLSDKFTKTYSIEIKEAFITALERDEVKKEYQRQRTTRLNSRKIVKLIQEWNMIKDIQLKFQVVKSDLYKLEQMDLYGRPEDFREKMEITHRSLDELKNSVIDILQTAIDKKNYNLIKNLSDNFRTQTTDIKDVFNRALESENVQKSIENSKKIRKMLCSSEQSSLNVIEKLILKIKNLINQLMNYFHVTQSVKKQSYIGDVLTLPSSNIELASTYSYSKYTNAVFKTIRGNEVTI